MDSSSVFCMKGLYDSKKLAKIPSYVAYSLQKKPPLKKYNEQKGEVDQGQILDDPLKEKERLARQVPQHQLSGQHVKAITY